jgi:hypothetical protein
LTLLLKIAIIKLIIITYLKLIYNSRQFLTNCWSPGGIRIFLCQVGGVSEIPRVPYGPSGFHLDFTRIPPGFHVKLNNNLAGLPAKEIPPGFQVESM